MSGEVLVSGRQAVLAALEAGRPMRRIVLARGARGASIELIVQRAREQGVPVQRVDGTVLEALVAEVGSSVRHQGVMALAATRPYRALEELLAMARQRGQPPLLVVLARVEDPGNLGAVARSADFLGAHGLVVAARRSAGLSPGAEKAAAGALESLGVARVVNLATAIEELKREGLWAIGAEADGQIPPWEVDLTGPLVLVLGGEDRGLGHAVRRACDVVVRIPRAGSVPSLNVAAAAAILLYEVSKQRASGRLSQGSAQPPRDGAQLFRGSARLPPQKPG